MKHPSYLCPPLSSCHFRQFGLLLATAMVLAVMTACGGSKGVVGISTVPPPGVFDHYKLTGDVTFVHDPSIVRQGTTYYSFSTDPGAPTSAFLVMRCSSDHVQWKICGQVFDQIPAWVKTQVPGVVNLWAPDISFFNGTYHLYYAGSTFGSNTSVIGLATNSTLDPSDPNYHWTDQGIVVESASSSDFNAIDPNILVDADQNVWLTYGSFWTGIKQRQIDPATGLPLSSNSTIYSLATRPGVPFDPIEGASLVHRGSFYYLFVSFDFCCNADPAQSNYKIAVSRGASPHGPFTDRAGIDMNLGGGTILLQGNGTTWSAPGGQTVFLDAQNGDLIVFHALQLPQGAAYLFVNPLTWPNNWPAIQP